MTLAGVVVVEVQLWRALLVKSLLQLRAALRVEQEGVASILRSAW
jgi:hypothetical protein